MQYRTLGKTNEKVSILGFGVMRMPIIDGDSSKINEEESIKMLRYAIDNGVDYIDTAYPYHGNDMSKPGSSEPFVGRALRNGYREKVKIATKLPSWMIESREQMDEILDEQLKRLEIDYVDFYLVHSLNKSYWVNMKKLGIFDFLEKAKASGKIKHIGFSFHDNIELFKEIIDAYDWEFCQIQYNYLDENYQAGKEGLEYAANKNIGVIIMEPLRGGRLVNNLPHEIIETFEGATNQKAPAEWALRWIWDNPNVGTVLSGMSTMEHVEQNIEYAGRGLADSFSSEDKEIVERVQNIFKHRLKVECTKCRYCMPCPLGVNIPEVFSFYNNYYLIDNEDSKNHFKYFYLNSLLKEEKASNCVECGKCETHCPQNIKIIKELKDVVNTFEHKEK